MEEVSICLLRAWNTCDEWKREREKKKRKCVQFTARIGKGTCYLAYGLLWPSSMGDGSAWDDWSLSLSQFVLTNPCTTACISNCIVSSSTKNHCANNNNQHTNKRVESSRSRHTMWSTHLCALQCDLNICKWTHREETNRKKEHFNGI